MKFKLHTLGLTKHHSNAHCVFDVLTLKALPDIAAAYKPPSGFNTHSWMPHEKQRTCLDPDSVAQYTHNHSDLVCCTDFRDPPSAVKP